MRLFRAPSEIKSYDTFAELCVWWQTSVWCIYIINFLEKQQIEQLNSVFRKVLTLYNKSKKILGML